MHPLIEQGPWGPHDEQLLRDILTTGPWCWPRPEQGKPWQVATGFGGARPALAPGQTLLVTVAGNEAQLWCLAPDGETPFGPRAHQYWRDAAHALPHSIPILWTSIDAQAAHPPTATFICCQGTHGRSSVLEGGSFGLSFALSLASRALGSPLPESIAASAAVLPSGALRPVEGLALKIDAVATLAPRVGRFLVAAPQASEAVAAAADRLTIEPLNSVADAIALCWPDLAQHLLAQGGAERDALVRSLFRLALQGKGSSPSWKPIGRAAHVALESWDGDLSLDERERLRFAAAVAYRHEENRGTLELPDQGWLRSLPQPQRLEVIAHTVQQATDTGTPSLADALELAEAHQVRGADAFPAHLKLLGATGRLQSILGRHQCALELQQDAARQWVDRALNGADVWDQVSYPLCEWYRLSGALEATAAFEAAENLQNEAATLGGTHLDDSPYVQLAHARGLALLGRGPEARTRLHQLATTSRQGEVRLVAERWLRYTAPEAQPAPDGEWPHWIGDLVALDAALADQADDRAHQVVERLRRSPMVDNLLRHAPHNWREDLPRYLQRFHPY